MATPEHHHYMGVECWQRGSTCTSDECKWATDAGIMPLHEDCEKPEPPPLSPEWWSDREAEASTLVLCRACHYGHFTECEDERCQSTQLEDRHE